MSANAGGQARFVNEQGRIWVSGTMRVRGPRFSDRDQKTRIWSRSKSLSQRVIDSVAFLSEGGRPSRLTTKLSVSPLVEHDGKAEEGL